MAEQKQECHIYIIGIGMGAQENLTVEAGKAIEEAGLLIGAKRMLEPYDGSRECVKAYQAEEIVKIIENNSQRASGIAVLLSGDSGFFSGTKELLEALYTVWGKEQVYSRVTVLPGISSLSYFCAKIGKSWENAEIVNLHGVQENLWQAVLTHEKVFAITGGNAQQQLKQLTEHGLGEIYGYVGENLSYKTDPLHERITEGTVRELAQKSYAPLAVLFLENSAVMSTNLWGLPDESFVRGEVPMTKAEVRAVVMSKLRIRETDVVYDIGAGTGSVSVEMALAARKGKVYAIEANPTAAELCKLNKGRFCLHNLVIVEGTAPDALLELPRPDVAFIGGSKGKMAEILELLLRKNPAVRLVINTVTLENTAKALALLDTEQFVDVEMVQLQVNKARKIGTSHMMMANNPITIFTAKGKENPS